VFLVICDLAVDKYLVYHFEELTFDCAPHRLEEILTDTISTRSFVWLPFVHSPLQFFHFDRYVDGLRRVRWKGVMPVIQ